jgi:hypothetical protein
MHMQADDLEGLTYMQKNHSCMSPTFKLQRGSRYIYIGLGTQLLNDAWVHSPCTSKCLQCIYMTWVKIQCQCLKFHSYLYSVTRYVSAHVYNHWVDSSSHPFSSFHLGIPNHLIWYLWWWRLILLTPSNS